MTTLPPVGSPAWRDDVEEHDAWVREMFAKNHPGEEPRPCDCGYFTTDALSSCSEAQRAKFCRPGAQKRLATHYRQEREKILRQKRVFPGPPCDGQGGCRWCGKTILDAKGQPSKTRSWHKDCLHTYFLHTRAETQLPHLIERDGKGCKNCGVWAGRWGHIWTENNPVDSLARRPDLARWLEGVDWPTTFITWFSGLEVDHVVALALVAHLPDDERRWYFSPENLQGLCHRCHVAKTTEDRRKIRALQANILVKP